MKEISLTNEDEYRENKSAIQILLEIENANEIHTVMKKGQLMKKHKTPFPTLE